MSTDLLDGLLTTAVSVLIALLWLDNLARSSRLSAKYRDARSYRAVVIAVLLLLGSVAYVVGSVGLYLWPPMLEVWRTGSS